MFLWPALALSTKRWHDREKSGWWNLILLIPIIGGLWFLIDCGVLPGTDGTNNFGEDPLRENTEPSATAPMRKVVYVIYVPLGLLLVAWPFFFFTLFFVNVPIKDRADELLRLLLTCWTWFYPLLFWSGLRLSRQAVRKDKSLIAIVLPGILPMLGPLIIFGSFLYQSSKAELESLLPNRTTIIGQALGLKESPLPNKITILGQELSLKEQKDNGSQGFIAEYIPSDKTWDNWNLMFAVRFVPGENLDPETSARGTAANILEKRSIDPIANAAVLTSEKGKGALVDFVVSSGGKTNTLPNIIEHNIWRFFKSKKGLVSYQIARRVYSSQSSGKEMRAFLKDIAKLRSLLVQELYNPKLPMPNVANEGVIAQDQNPGKTIDVKPQGEYAEIDTSSTIRAVEILRGKDEGARKALIDDIQKNSANYMPPVFFTLAQTLWELGKKEDAYFWFNAGYLRASFDAARCADVSARQAVAVMIMGLPQELYKSQFDDVDKLKEIVLKVIKWDEETPHNYDHRWINLHGMGAMISSLDKDKKEKVPQLSIPKSEWDSLAKQQREKYFTELTELSSSTGKMKKQKNIDEPDALGQTALMLAATSGELERVQEVLENGANVNIHDNKGWTALMLAAYWGYPDIIQVLLIKRADPNAKTLKNTTALMCAAGKGNVKVVQLLLSNGADVNFKDSDGKSALTYAREKGYTEIVELLRKKGPLQTKYVPTPDMAMSFAIKKDSREWVQESMDGNNSGIIIEFVPQGESINAWKEMVAQQIAFTKISLREYVDGWKAMLLRADPKIELKEEVNQDGSILVIYTSILANETSMRRFIKGSDGIYALAYHVRPKLKNEEIFAVWSSIIQKANLVPNPEKK